MGLDPISNVATAAASLGDVAAKIIGLFKESPTVKAQLQHDIDLAELQGQIQLMLAQVQVNAVEAANKSTFVAGWRPYIGWICGTGMAIPMLIWLIQSIVMLCHGNYNIPPPNTGELITVLLGLLGLSTQRTVEKVMSSNAPGNIGH